MLHEVLDYVELAFVGRVADELDAETGRNHRQAAQAPRLPVGCVFVRFLKGTEMTERPGHLVSVSLDVPVFLIFRSEYIAMSRATEGFSAIQTIIRFSFLGNAKIMQKFD